MIVRPHCFYCGHYRKLLHGRRFNLYFTDSLQSSLQHHLYYLRLHLGHRLGWLQYRPHSAPYDSVRQARWGLLPSPRFPMVPNSSFGTRDFPND